jgi:hypothetical protein
MSKKTDRFTASEIVAQLLKICQCGIGLDFMEQSRVAGAVAPAERVKLLMALSATNLIETMKADFITQKLDEAAREQIAREFLEESLRRQTIAVFKNMDDIQHARVDAMRIVGELQKFWNEESDPEGTGPGPRYYCVKEILGRLGGGPDYTLHDTLFEMMYTKHKEFIDFFRQRLAD